MRLIAALQNLKVGPERTTDFRVGKTERLIGLQFAAPISRGCRVAWDFSGESVPPGASSRNPPLRGGESSAGGSFSRVLPGESPSRTPKGQGNWKLENRERPIIRDASETLGRCSTHHWYAAIAVREGRPTNSRFELSLIYAA